MIAPTRSIPGIFQTPTPRPEARIRLFCFPYAGGGASIFRRWPAFLPDEIEVVMAQPPARENRLMAPPIHRMDALVDQLEHSILPLLDRPFAFFGHSLGAVVQLELAHRLRDDHGHLPTHLVFSARRPPHFPSARGPIHHLDDEGFIDGLRALGGTPEKILQHRELMGLLMPSLRADFEMIETYDPHERAPLPCPITAFGGRNDLDVSRSQLEAWALYGTGPFDLHIFDGGHFFINEGAGEAVCAALLPVLEVRGQSGR